MVPLTTPARNLRIGTSGWNYPTGRGTWNGIFYPPARGRRRGPGGFDELAFHAEHFDTVEVNSTFYGQPRADVSRRWSARTPPGFEFSIKLHQTFTHLKMLETPTHADVDEFRAAWTQIDEPKFKFSIRQNYLPNVSGFYYMRLHGRNAAQ